DHAMRAGADRRVDHDQQLHQRVVGRDARAGVATRRLDEEHIGAADRLVEAAVDLAVGERLERYRAQFDVELVGDLCGKLRVRAPGEQHQPLVVRADQTGRGARHRGERRSNVGHVVWAYSEPVVDGSSASRLREAYPSMLRWRSRATPSAPSGMSFVMTEPAAVHASSPTLTGATNVTSTALLTRDPIVVRCLLWPS